MSSTNKTANYELSQFVGTDIPSILSDYNGDMRKIDAGIAEVATSAGSSASAVSALAGRVTTAENSITTLNGALEVTNQRSIQNQTAITAVQGVIPSDASTENLLATVEEVSDIADDVRGLDTRVTALEQGAGGVIAELTVNNYSSDNSNRELAEAITTAITEYMTANGIETMAKINIAISISGLYKHFRIETINGAMSGGYAVCTDIRGTPSASISQNNYIIGLGSGSSAFIVAGTVGSNASDASIDAGTKCVIFA